MRLLISNCFNGGNPTTCESGAVPCFRRDNRISRIQNREGFALETTFVNRECAEADEAILPQQQQHPILLRQIQGELRFAHSVEMSAQQLEHRALQLT